MGEIRALAERLEALRAARQGRLWVLPLHSSVAPADQRKVRSISQLQAFSASPALRGTWVVCSQASEGRSPNSNPCSCTAFNPQDLSRCWSNPAHAACLRAEKRGFTIYGSSFEVKPPKVLKKSVVHWRG